MWDMGLCRLVPGLRLAAPRDAETLREELREAVAVEDAPTVVRFSKGKVPADLPAIARVGTTDVLLGEHHAQGDDVLLVAVGSMVPRCLDVAERLRAHGVGVTVVDPRWVVPVDASLLALGRDHRLVVVVEDGAEVGGLGWALERELRTAGVDTPLLGFALPQEFLDVGERDVILDAVGLAPQAIARAVVEQVARATRDTSPASTS